MISFLLTVLAASQVSVLSPDGVAQEFRSGSLASPPDGEIPAATATFGTPTYGSVLVGRGVRFPPDRTNYCDGSEAYGEQGRQAVMKLHEEGVKVIFLLDRGGCSFATKVAAAESYGASAVIVTDADGSEWDRKTLRRVIISEPGDASTGIKIPSVLVAYEDGRELVNAAENPTSSFHPPGHSPLMLQLRWDIPQQDTVDIDLWTSANYVNAGQFVHDILPAMRDLQGLVDIRPHFYVIAMPNLDDASAARLCYEANREYCFPSAGGGHTAEGLPGDQVLHEDVRQLCLIRELQLKFHMTESAAELTWLDYVSEYHVNCSDGIGGGSQCGTHVLDGIASRYGHRGLTAIVDECTRDTQWVRTELTEQRESNAWAPLALRINGMRFAGELDPRLALKAVCSGFKNRPEYCVELLEAGNWANTSRMATPLSWSFLDWVMVFSLMTSTVGGALYLWQRRTRDQLRDDLRKEILSEVQSSMREWRGSDKVEMCDYRRSGL